jgi:hypothetical protein
VTAKVYYLLQKCIMYYADVIIIISQEINTHLLMFACMLFLLLLLSDNICFAASTSRLNSRPGDKYRSPLHCCDVL